MDLTKLDPSGADDERISLKYRRHQEREKVISSGERGKNVTAAVKRAWNETG